LVLFAGDGNRSGAGESKDAPGGNSRTFDRDGLIQIQLRILRAAGTGGDQAQPTGWFRGAELELTGASWLPLAAVSLVTIEALGKLRILARRGSGKAGVFKLVIGGPGVHGLQLCTNPVRAWARSSGKGLRSRISLASRWPGRPSRRSRQESPVPFHRTTGPKRAEGGRRG